MVQVNIQKREVNCKLVYYGPELAGKSTSLHAVAARSPHGGTVTSLNSEADRTLFFDYLQVELGKIDGLGIKLHVYTVPPHTSATETRRAILRDVDGVIFVVDSTADGAAEALRCMEQLEDDLRLQGLDPAQVPVVFQWNKRDRTDALSVDELRALLDPAGVRQGFETVATQKTGVIQTLKRIACQVLEQISKDYGLGTRLETRKIPRPKAVAETRKVRRSTRRLTESARLRSLSAEVRPARAERGKVVGIKPRSRIRRLLSFGR